MKLAIHSDLHLECNNLPENFLSNEDYDVLVLAGDIVTHNTMGRLREITCLTDKPILYVLGNHEFYTRDKTASVSSILDDYKELCDSLGITLLNNSKAVVDGVTFVGSTAWSTMTSYPELLSCDYTIRMRNNLSDFHMIPEWSVMDMVMEAQRCRNYIYSNIHTEQCDVLITHFPLSRKLDNPKFVPSTITNYFVNEWMDDVDYCDKKVKACIYGHTHGYSGDEPVVVNGVPCYNNQHGYFTECEGTYNPNYIVEV